MLASSTKLKDKLSSKTANGDLAHFPSLENSSITANQNINRTLVSTTTAAGSAEIEKWKKFGYLMAESYDELKKENEKLKHEREKDRKIVHALKDQVDKLKMIIKARNMDGNIDCREKEIEY